MSGEARGLNVKEGGRVMVRQYFACTSQSSKEEVKRERKDVHHVRS